MELEEIKTAIRGLSIEDRRKAALFILDLEREHVEGTFGPKLVQGLEAFSRTVQETVDKIKTHVSSSRDGAKKS